LAEKKAAIHGGRAMHYYNVLFPDGTKFTASDGMTLFNEHTAKQIAGCIGGRLMEVFL
jgi:hypothetical protein